MPTPTNLFTPLPDARQAEVFTDLLVRPGCRVERIVSQGQVTSPERPYQQAHDEWVVVLSGSARVLMDDVETALAPGDHLFIPAGMQHRVTFTDPAQPTVWLAIHIGEAASDA
ncbi:cupin domain-containing protein [Pseudomonas sp. LJDD11]|uniref:cupin domain-containing protein n=1 Tax=Pseudomonas sp. LJDD11 TaxID=2931984 RepID=UPI00211C7DEC|nr:cupin domain-containing protein [Pseudomonas sp. LJDD11]MCQ9426269.1 cupin domain-containing protein [Pseudomonas sp. LJDD11]